MGVGVEENLRFLMYTYYAYTLLLLLPFDWHFSFNILVSVTSLKILEYSGIIKGIDKPCN